jgi:hypothetical protein
MKQQLKRYGAMAVSMLMAVGMLACHRTARQESSSVSGATIAEIASAYGDRAKPRYELLMSETEVKFAFFFTFEEERPTSSDPAIVEMNRIRSWLLDGAGINERAFLQDGVEAKMPAPQGAIHDQITGTAPGFGGSRTIRYVFTLFAGSPAGVARDFGKAMATHHVTMMSGHFYPRDLRAAESGSGQQTGVPSWFYRTGQFSQIYGPAMESFKQHATNSFLYRIVVFNGCESEKIEDLVLGAAQEVGQGNIEIIGQRGRSNYYDFGEQATSLILNLMKMKPWTEVLGGFKVSNVRGERMKPVLRNAVIGG